MNLYIVMGPDGLAKILLCALVVAALTGAAVLGWASRFSLTRASLAIAIAAGAANMVVSLVVLWFTYRLAY